MEQDYRTIHLDLGASGSYFGFGKTLGPVRTVMNSDGKVQSGIIQSLTVMISGSAFNDDLRFIFSESASAASSNGSSYLPTFADLKTILGVVSTTGSIGNNSTISVGGHVVATFGNLGIPFNCDALYVASVFDGETTSSFGSGSVWATIGYALGQSR
jgi:hypothetical protein